MIGIENEYGITASRGGVPIDPTVAATAVVGADLGPGHPAVGASAALANYRSHVPLPDDLTRIFLEESSYATRMLVNGGRLYVDHGHPEYCGPEVRSAHEAVVWDLAGDQLVMAAAEQAGERLGGPVRLFKNNTDGKGASYGCHENYLLPRSVPFEDVIAGFTAFLVSRIVVTGAGRVGVGQASERPGFQLSQRADFFEALVGLETTVRRPIINTRDEPHAHAGLWRRLHVITGDALIGQYSTWLKVGTAALVLSAIAAGTRFVRLADPLAAFTAFSQDPTLTATAADLEGNQWTAVELQTHCAEQITDTSSIGDGEQVLAAWTELLADARTDPSLLADRVDWAAKYRLLTGMIDRGGLTWSDPKLAALDLQWAELDAQRGLGMRLLASGGLRSVVDPVDVEKARCQPPRGARPELRAALLAKFRDDLLASSWDQLTLMTHRGRPVTLSLDEPLGMAGLPATPDAWLAGMDSVDQLVAAWSAIGGRLTAS